MKSLLLVSAAAVFGAAALLSVPCAAQDAPAWKVSIRDVFLGKNTYDSPIAGLKQLGLDTVESNLDRDYTMMDLETAERVSVKGDDEAKAYKAKLDALGVHCCALLTAVDFSAGDAESNIQWIVRAVEIADILGAQAVRIDSAMKRERELDFDTRVNLFADNLSEILKRTEGKSVALGIENHGFQGNNLAFLLNIYTKVNSPRLGSTLDTGNFYWRGYPLGEVYGILRLLAPYAKHTHFKNINYPADQREEIREAGWKYAEYACPLEQGDIDTVKVLEILRDAGYTGTLCMEDESVGHRKTREERAAQLERNTNHMRAAAAALK